MMANIAGPPFNDPSLSLGSTVPYPQSTEPYHYLNYHNRVNGYNEYLSPTSRQSSSMTLGGPGPALQSNGSGNGDGDGVSLSSWASQISASLSNLGEQITAVSQIVPNTHRLDGDVGVVARLEAIELRHASLEGELAELRTLVEQTSTTSQVQGEGEQSVAEVSTKVDDVLASLKLEQSRLYPRLLNATANISKMSIKPLPTASGKPPPNFPATRGEFEHLTKERYEDIMKAYEIPIKGDTNAKREAVRTFIGLPP